MTWYQYAIQRLRSLLELYISLEWANEKINNSLKQTLAKVEEKRVEAEQDARLYKEEVKLYRRKFRRAVDWILGSAVLLLMVGVVMWVCFGFWAAFPLLLQAVLNIWAGVSMRG